MRIAFLALALFLVTNLSPRASFADPRPPKLLIVIAHPDDEYYFAGFIFWLTHEKKALVDEIIITSGESGSRYSDLGELYYHKKFKEPGDAKALSSQREIEAKASDVVLGIHHTDFLHEKDFGFTTSLDETRKKWDSRVLADTIFKQMKIGFYDGVLVLAPLQITHGHHKTASMLALEAAQKIAEPVRPFLLAATTDVETRPFQDKDHELEVKEGRAFTELKGEPLTKISSEVKPFRFDRNHSFGYQNKLSYQFAVNWMIAEHKTQGALQLMMNRDDIEVIRTFQSSGSSGLERARQFFSTLTSSGS